MTTLRVYEEDTKQCNFYKEMYKHQTLDFVLSMKQKYSKLDNVKMTMNKALSLMDSFVDPSDPDIDEPNSVHAYQTAERIRKKFPENKEYQIIGLIHDLGKVLFTFDEPDYAVVGDTFVVGCIIPGTVVCYEETKSHPDFDSNVFGIYDKYCGIDNLHLSYGHDEYLYEVYTFEHLKRRFLYLYYINEINFIKKTNYYVYRNGYYWYAIQSYEHFSI